MKTIFVILSFLMICTQMYAQEKLKGYITDTNNLPLSYVNIGFVGTPIGTVSDKNGFFELEYSAKTIRTFDTLKVSMVGFSSQSATLSQLRKDTAIHFSSERSITQINEVLVVSSQSKKKRLGKFNISALNMICNFALSDIPEQNLGAEIGRRFSIGKRKAKINTVRFYVLHNNFDTVGFRINLYELKDNRPQRKLVQENIITEITNKQKGWIDIDISSYNVAVSGNIVAAVEWIYKSEQGYVLALPIAMPTNHTHFYKYGSQNNWKCFYSMTTRMQMDVVYTN